MNVTCSKAQRELLDWGWSLEQRGRVTACLAHFDSCVACREAVTAYDAMRDVFEDEGPEPQPAGGWSAFENRLIEQILGWRRPPYLLPLALALSAMMGTIGWVMYLVRILKS